MVRQSVSLLCLVVSSTLGVAACGNDSARGPARARADQIPVQVAVDRATLTYGFYTSRNRSTFDVGAFRIAKWPTTVAEYRQCVEAGACTEPAKNACLVRDSGALVHSDHHGGDRLPLTCAGVAQARAYCAWVGGALPTLTQWMLAARGREVTRFAWGNKLPQCEHRPDVLQPDGARPCEEANKASFEVGRHPAGASPFGVEDVLLTPGELIAPSMDAPVASCAAPFGACVAYGVRPGAIDSVAPVEVARADHGERSPHPYAFRCAFSGDSK
jgi:hypothetical protein